MVFFSFENYPRSERHILFQSNHMQLPTHSSQWAIYISFLLLFPISNVFTILFHYKRLDIICISRNMTSIYYLNVFYAPTLRGGSSFALTVLPKIFNFVIKIQSGDIHVLFLVYDDLINILA